MKNEKKLELICLTLTLLMLCSCVKRQQSTYINKNPKDTAYFEKWFVYDQPLNGYEVTIHWLCDKNQGFWGTGLFSFTKDGTTKIITHLIDLDGWYYEKELMDTPDTIVLNQYYDDALQPYLDWRAIVGFADFNFDGNKELVICETPRPYRAFEEDYWLDCETFTFYLDAPKGFLEINNEPFYRLGSETTTYYFRDGNPYKSEVVRHEKP